MNEKNKNMYLSFWLLLITFMVVAMIIIGGLTRLTGSGLSITRWDIISGILPPSTTSQWENSFSLYKKIPEFILLNSSMNLEQFKVIFWWEYIHRLLGRAIGIFYFLPFIYFTWKRLIKKQLLISLCSIFLLILLQGFIGWYMVKSGLTERTDVSHYRLSLHLTLAFVIFILLLWNYLKYNNIENLSSYEKLPYFLPISLLILIIIQISVGAFVSGLDAGQIYQSWPMMNESYFPDDSTLSELFTLKSFESPSLVQFMHRNIAYLIFFLFLYIISLIYKNNRFAHLRKTALLVFVALLIQILLGILTIISGAQIILASMHQIGSIILVTASLMLVFKNSKIN